MKTADPSWGVCRARTEGNREALAGGRAAPIQMHSRLERTRDAQADLGVDQRPPQRPGPGRSASLDTLASQPSRSSSRQVLAIDRPDPIDVGVNEETSSRGVEGGLQLSTQAVHPDGADADSGPLRGCRDQVQLLCHEAPPGRWVGYASTPGGATNAVAVLRRPWRKRSKDVATTCCPSLLRWSAQSGAATRPSGADLDESSSSRRRS